MYLRMLLGTAGVLLLAGCAGTTVPVWPSNHPANPAAVEAPLPPASQTLAVNGAILSSPEMNPATLKPEMGGMHHDMKGMQPAHDKK